MERRRKLGPLANKSLNTSCFTSKIKCGYCGKSFYRNIQTNKAATSIYGEKVIRWICGTKKKKGCMCEAKEISDIMLKRVCAEALDIEVFDENVFKERVEEIQVPEYGTLVFHFKDGTVDTRHWENIGHKEYWDKYHDYISENGKVKHHITELTSMIKCCDCGCNFRHIQYDLRTSKTGKASYWRCAKYGKGCKFVSLKEEILKDLIAKLMETEIYDAELFKEKIKKIYAKDKNILEVYFKDGTIKSIIYN